MGNGFKFRLDTLLDIRVEKEDESKRLFTKSQREKQLVENKLNDMKSNYQRYNGINKGETLVYQKIKKNYLFALDRSIATSEKDLAVKKREVDMRRNDLIKKQIDRKTVDILKEKQKVAFYNEQNRLEQISNDEFALYSYMRNQGKEVK